MPYTKQQLRSYAAQQARHYGIPVEVFLRQLSAESGFNPSAVSHAGARGVAQIMPFHDVDPSRPGRQLAGRDPLMDIRWAANHNAQNLRKYGNVQDMLSVYNSGRPWARGQKIGETRHYVNKVLSGVKPGRAGAGSTGAPGGLYDDTAPGPLPMGTNGEDRKRLAGAYFLSKSMEAASGQPDTGSSLLALAMMRQKQEAADGLHVQPYAVGGESGVAPAGREAMVEAIRVAQRMGLSVRENPLVDKVDPVHVTNSNHYRSLGGGVGGAADISGNPAKMAAFFKWAARRYPNMRELFYDPLGGYKNGKRIRAIGGHGGHVHFAP